MRKQPNLWSLAVLLYQILVDIKGPFPEKPATDDPKYEWFRGGDYARDYPDWPRSWQKAECDKVLVQRVRNSLPFRPSVI